MAAAKQLAQVAADCLAVADAVANLVAKSAVVDLAAAANLVAAVESSAAVVSSAAEVASSANAFSAAELASVLELERSVLEHLAAVVASAVVDLATACAAVALGSSVQLDNSHTVERSLTQLKHQETVPDRLRLTPTRTTRLADHATSC